MSFISHQIVRSSSLRITENQNSIDFSINIATPLEEASKKLNKNYVVDEDCPTEKSFYLSPTQNSSINTPSTKKKFNRPQDPNRLSEHPARHLKLSDLEKLVKKPTKNFAIGDVSSDFTSKILENDKKWFQNELLFRKYRKHAIMKNIIDDDDSWDWSSHGSSPTRRVKFSD